jgi:hypothetical protein
MILWIRKCYLKLYHLDADWVLFLFSNVKSFRNKENKLTGAGNAVSASRSFFFSPKKEFFFICVSSSLWPFISPSLLVQFEQLDWEMKLATSNKFRILNCNLHNYAHARIQILNTPRSPLLLKS